MHKHELKPPETCKSKVKNFCKWKGQEQCVCVFACAYVLVCVHDTMPLKFSCQSLNNATIMFIPYFLLTNVRLQLTGTARADDTR